MTAIGDTLAEPVGRLVAVDRIAPGARADFGIEVDRTFYRVTVERGEPRRTAPKDQR